MTNNVLAELGFAGLEPVTTTARPSGNRHPVSLQESNRDR
jgi:hypothetical protein